MQLQAASVTIYPNGFFIYFSGRGGRLGRILASSRLAMKKGCILFYFFSRLAGWLAAGFRAIAFLAGGRRPDKQSDGGQLLLFYKEKVGCWVAQKLNRMIPNIPPFVKVFFDLFTVFKLSDSTWVFFILSYLIACFDSYEWLCVCVMFPKL